MFVFPKFQTPNVYMITPVIKVNELPPLGITITENTGEKRIDLCYPMKGKEVAVVSMFSDNVLYQIRKLSKVLLITNEAICCQKENLQLGS